MIVNKLNLEQWWANLCNMQDFYAFGLLAMCVVIAFLMVPAFVIMMNLVCQKYKNAEKNKLVKSLFSVEAGLALTCLVLIFQSVVMTGTPETVCVIPTTNELKLGKDAINFQIASTDEFIPSMRVYTKDGVIASTLDIMTDFNTMLNRDGTFSTYDNSCGFVSVPIEGMKYGPYIGEYIVHIKADSCNCTDYDYNNAAHILGTSVLHEKWLQQQDPNSEFCMDSEKWTYVPLDEDSNRITLNVETFVRRLPGSIT